MSYKISVIMPALNQGENIFRTRVENKVETP